jgi:hypothetical protein
VPNVPVQWRCSSCTGTLANRRRKSNLETPVPEVATMEIFFFSGPKYSGPMARSSAIYSVFPFAQQRRIGDEKIFRRLLFSLGPQNLIAESMQLQNSFTLGVFGVVVTTHSKSSQSDRKWRSYRRKTVFSFSIFELFFQVFNFFLFRILLCILQVSLALTSYKSPDKQKSYQRKRVDL